MAEADSCAHHCFADLQVSKEAAEQGLVIV